MGLSRFLLIHSFLLGQVDSTKYKGGIRLAEGVLYFANFAPFLNHKLSHSEIMDIQTVFDEEECIAACTENSECRSLNFKTTPDESAKHICQLLNTDKFASYEEFEESLDFNHYSFTVGIFQKSYIIVTVFCYQAPGGEGFFLFQASLWMGRESVGLIESWGRALSEGNLFLISQYLIRISFCHYFIVPFINYYEFVTYHDC